MVNLKMLSSATVLTAPTIKSNSGTSGIDDHLFRAANRRQHERTSTNCNALRFTNSKPWAPPFLYRTWARGWKVRAQLPNVTIPLINCKPSETSCPALPVR